MRNAPKKESGQHCDVGPNAKVEHSPPNAAGVPQFQDCQWPKQRLGEEAVARNEDAYDYGIF
jgi:hypothetical protein